MNFFVSAATVFVSYKIVDSFTGPASQLLYMENL